MDSSLEMNWLIVGDVIRFARKPVALYFDESECIKNVLNQNRSKLDVFEILDRSATAWR